MLLTEEQFNNSQVKFNYEDYNDYVNQMSQFIGGGITSLPKFDMDNLPMYEKDDSEQEYISGTEPSGIAKLLQYIPFIGDKSLSVNLLRNLLPKQSPEAIGMRNFYGSQFGLTPTSSVASGIMAGYNPISGGLFGRPIQYGLAGAMQRRIENIIGRKTPQTEASRERIAQLRDLQLSEMRDRADRGESLSSIGKSTFSGPGMAFEAQNKGTFTTPSGEKGFYGGR